MNGTSGIRPKMAHASFGPRAMSLRDARSIHMRTTARGWMKQRRSSKSFFIAPNLPGTEAGRLPGIRDEASRAREAQEKPGNKEPGGICEQSDTGCPPSSRAPGDSPYRRTPALAADTDVRGQPVRGSQLK